MDWEAQLTQRAIESGSVSAPPVPSTLVAGIRRDVAMSEAVLRQFKNKVGIRSYNALRRSSGHERFPKTWGEFCDEIELWGGGVNDFCMVMVGYGVGYHTMIEWRKAVLGY